MENNNYNEPRQDESTQNSNPYGAPVENPYVNKQEEYAAYEEIPPTGQPNMEPVYTAPQQPEKTGLAVASLVLGIISVVISCMGVNIILAVIAIILGAVYLSKKQAARRGMAIAGLVLGIVSIAIFILLVVLATVFMLSGIGLYGDMYNEILNGMY